MLSLKSPEIHRSSVAASAEAVFINEDLLLQILVRLPIRSLLKFKFVSKRWCSLISSPSFSRQVSITHPLTPSGIFFRSRYRFRKPYVFEFIDLSPNPSRVPFESLDLTSQSNESAILQSCNGLLLCTTRERSFVTDCYIHNPTTNQFAMIPYPEGEDGKRDRRIIFCMNLAFDPSLSSNYEVVCVQSFEVYLDKYQIKIYSSKTGLWRRPYNDVFQAPLVNFYGGVYWNRAIHWMSPWNVYFYFNLCEEKVHQMQMPPIVDLSSSRLEYFGDCGGHLILISMSDLECNVWEMPNDQSGWFVKYHLHLQTFYAAYPRVTPEGSATFSVLGMIVQSDDQVDEESYLVLHLHGEGEVIRMNVKSGSFRRLTEVEVGQGDAYFYIESLNQI